MATASVSGTGVRHRIRQSVATKGSVTRSTAAVQPFERNPAAEAIPDGSDIRWILPADRTRALRNLRSHGIAVAAPALFRTWPVDFAQGAFHFHALNGFGWSPQRILLSSLWRCSVIRRIVLVAAVLGLAVAPAYAANITLGGAALLNEGQVSTVAGTTTVNFNGLGTGTQSFVTGIATYTNANIFTCPCAGDGDLKNDLSNGARAFGSNFGVEQTFEVAFSQPLDYFGFYWGSPDADNVVTFFNGATQLFAFTGTQLNALGVGFGHPNAAFVNFAAVGSERFTRVVFKPGAFLIETDNHAYRVAAVPEPASLLLVGIGLVWVAARRRRQVR